MFFKIVLPFFALGFISLPSVAAEIKKETKQKDDYPYLNFGAGVPSAKSKPGKRGAKKKQPKTVEAPLAETAASELTVSADDRTLAELPTPATVRSSVDPIVNPVRRPAFEVGVGFSQFRPAGRMKLPGLEAYDLDSLGSRPMLALELRWLPLKFATAQPTSLGPYVGLGYVQHPVSLRSPTGVAISSTVLHSISAQVGGVFSWQPSEESAWGARLQMGLGQFNSIQASNSAYANHSSSESFLASALFAERKVLERFKIFAGYEHRLPLKSEPEEIVLQRSLVLGGVSGGFQ